MNIQDRYSFFYESERFLVVRIMVHAGYSAILVISIATNSGVPKS